MIVIAHRGNVTGPSKDENSPTHIDKALSLGYDVEVDLFVEDTTLLLGHDSGTYPIEREWLRQRKNKLWIHCKNFEALKFLSRTNFNFFYHANDDYTITSLGYIWAYPGQKTTDNFILVMPEAAGIAPNKGVDCFGVCTDYSNEWSSL